jgi:uncharacterized membrane protein
MANYFIIGGDGKEYGPVTDADVRQWIAEARLNAQSRAKAESDAEFRPLSAFPEFATALGGNVPPSIGPLKLHSTAPAATSTPFAERDYELELGGCISRGYQTLKDHFGLLFLTALTLWGIEILIALFGMIPIVGMVFSLVNMVIAGPLMGGVFWVYLSAVRGRPGEVGDMFAGFRQCFGQLFLGKLIPGLIAALCLIPVVIAAVVLIAMPAATHHHDPDPKTLLILIPVGLICLIPMIYLQTCWLFTLPLIIDKRMDFGAAMKTSWKMVNKHWWQVFGLTVLVGLLNLAGALACLIGLLFTVPIGIAALMHAYETIFGESDN